MAKYEDVEGCIHSVETLSAHDGPGLRYVVFFQGCPFTCLYCHNPDTRKFRTGERVRAGDQLAEILRCRNYISGGVTLSGGEPLAQPEFAAALAHLCKANGIHCALDTSGGILLEASQSAIDAADLILLDFKCFSESNVFEKPGFEMENTWSLLDYCQRVNKNVWARYVVVPGLTVVCDKEGQSINTYNDFIAMNANLVEGISKIRSYSCVEKIEFLPFHKMGEHKWKELGLEYRLGHIDVPSADVLAWCKTLI